MGDITPRMFRGRSSATPLPKTATSFGLNYLPGVVWRRTHASYSAERFLDRACPVSALCNFATPPSVLYCISEAAMNMLKGFRLAAVVLTVFFLGPGILQAQRTAPASTSASAQRRMAPARPTNTVRVSPLHPPHAAVARNRGHIGSGAPSSNNFDNNANGFVGFGGAPLSVQQLLDPVPGMGFNFSDLAARDRDLDIKAVIDPVTQWRLAIAERLLRDNRGFGGFAGTGGFILDGGGVYTVPEEPSSEPAAAAPAPQPQIIVVQAPPPGAPNAEQAARESAPQSQPAQPPLPDVGQFTLVLRNGTTIQAVAFTRKSDSIVYITTDGTRRTLAVADLDSAATQRVNQEHGTPLNLSL